MLDSNWNKHINTTSKDNYARVYVIINESIIMNDLSLLLLLKQFHKFIYTYNNIIKIITYLLNIFNNKNTNMWGWKKDLSQGNWNTLEVIKE